jgi:hypothetical protein
VDYNEYDQFDWRAIMLLQSADRTSRSIFGVPRGQADLVARKDKPPSKTAHLRYFRIDEVGDLFSEFINNFGLFPMSAKQTDLLGHVDPAFHT